MLVSSTPIGASQPSLLLDSVTDTASVALSVPADSGTPAVVVTLSRDAQEILAQGTTPTDPARIIRGQLAQAVAVLNDTSGSVSADDQFTAFKLVSQTLIHGPAGQGEADPNLQFASALVDSPFAQHLNQLFGYMASQTTTTSSADPFSQRVTDDVRILAAFDGLPRVDQQLYVSAQAFHTETTYELPWVHQSGAVIQTPDDFRANLQARIEIDRALGAAIEDPRYAAATAWNGHFRNDTDARVLALRKLAAAAGDQQMIDLTELRYSRNAVDWTQKAQAYLDRYGPSPSGASSGDAAPAAAPAPFVLKPTAPNPDTRKVLDSIATLNDPTASIDDRMAALDGPRLKNSPASSWVLGWMSDRTAFAKAIDTAGSALSDRMMSIGRQAQARGDDVPPDGARLTLDYLNGRSGDDQRLIARAYGYSDVGSWKADLESQATAFTTQYGKPGASGSSDASQPWPATQADKGRLEALKTLEQVSISQKQFVEAERLRRANVDSGTAGGIDAPDGTPASPVDPNSAKALETLRQIIDNLHSLAAAERARRTGNEPGQDVWSASGRLTTPGAKARTLA